MRHYEIMLLVHPDHANQVPPIIERYKQLVENAQGTVHRSERVEGTVHRLEQFKRRLAYPLKKLNKGYYVLMNIECDASTQQEIQKNADFNDLIIRCLSIQRKTAITAPSLLSDRPAGAATDSGQTPEIKREPRKSKYRPAIDLAEADIDYKNVELLNHCLTDTKKIPRRRTTGATAKQQRLLRQACKRARFVGLLPHCDKYDQPEIN